MWRLRAAVPEGSPPRLPEAARRGARPRTRWLASRGPRASTYLIDRYLVGQYLTFLGIGTAVASVLILVVDLIQYLDRFLRAKPPFIYIVQHLLYRLPGSLYEGLPIIVLVSTVLLFLTLTQQRELDASRPPASASTGRACPILLVAFAISLGSGLLQETVLPGLNAKAEEIDRVKIRGNQPRHLQRQTQIWYRSSDTRFLRMELLDPIERSLEGLLVRRHQPPVSARRPPRREQGPLDRRGWMLSDGVYRQIGPNNHVTWTPSRSGWWSCRSRSTT